MDIEEYMSEFAHSFVAKNRRGRWVGFLTTRPPRIFKHSSDLLSHLDSRYLRREENLERVCEPTTQGVFYDFHDEPRILTFKEAKAEGEWSDALFIVNPKLLAVYFFHEGENFVCRKVGI